MAEPDSPPAALSDWEVRPPSPLLDGGVLAPGVCVSEMIGGVPPPSPFRAPPVM